MKLRYTPLQCKVKTYEESLAEKGLHPPNNFYRELKGTPVVIGELHSMIAPFILTLKKLKPDVKIAYVMTDSASLPMYLSNTVFHLKNDSLIEGSVTCGHAFGGDLETVNIYTALIAAKNKLKADVILLTPGPGVVGTSTRYGYSGIEQGEHIDRVRKMQGVPVVIPRISFSDLRRRHFGLSHHTLTALGEIASQSAHLPLPPLDKAKLLIIYEQLKTSGLLEKHKITIVNRPRNMTLNWKNDRHLQTMGRGIKQDPAFFFTVICAACFTEKIIN